MTSKPESFAVSPEIVARIRKALPHVMILGELIGHEGGDYGDAMALLTEVLSAGYHEGQKARQADETANGEKDYR